MPGFAPHLAATPNLRALLPVCLVAVLGAACGQAAAPPPRVDLTIGTAFAGGSWDTVAHALAGEYTKRLPGVTTEARTDENLEAIADDVQEGRLQLAILDVETAYIAFSTGTAKIPEPHRDLRAIAVLFSTAVHVVARTNTGIASIADFKGKRVGMGAAGSSTNRAATLILAGHGVTVDQITPVSLTAAEMATAIRAGTLDAAFIYAPFQNPVVADLTGADDVRLIPLERSSLGSIQEGHHFLKSTTMPGGMYKNQEDDVLTVGMDVMLLCRQPLPDQLVYDLTKTLFDALPVLRQAHPSAAGIDPDRGPTTAIPLHSGAARYYRERELLR